MLSFSSLQNSDTTAVTREECEVWGEISKNS